MNLEDFADPFGYGENIICDLEDFDVSLRRLIISKGRCLLHDVKDISPGFGPEMANLAIISFINYVESLAIPRVERLPKDLSIYVDASETDNAIQGILHNRTDLFGAKLILEQITNVQSLVNVLEKLDKVMRDCHDLWRCASCSNYVKNSLAMLSSKFHTEAWWLNG